MARVGWVSNHASPSLQFTVFTGSAVLITVVHYCNFCQLSSWMRSSLATVVGAGPLLLLYISLCPDRYVDHCGLHLAPLPAGAPFLTSHVSHPCRYPLPLLCRLLSQHEVVSNTYNVSNLRKCLKTNMQKRKKIILHDIICMCL